MPRTFNAFATGERIPPAYDYVGTFMIRHNLPDMFFLSETLVFHLHELVELWDENPAGIR